MSFLTVKSSVTKEKCSIVHASDPLSWHRTGQPQVGRAGCRILDLHPETACNIIRANCDSFMCVSATVNTTKISRSFHTAYNLIKILSQCQKDQDTSEKTLYIPVHFANISQYQPGHLHFRLQQQFQACSPLCFHYKSTLKFPELIPKKIINIFFLLSSQTVGCFGIMFISCFLTAGTKISSDGKIKNPKYFGQWIPTGWPGCGETTR